MHSFVTAGTCSLLGLSFPCHVAAFPTAAPHIKIYSLLYFLWEHILIWVPDLIYLHCLYVNYDQYLHLFTNYQPFPCDITSFSFPHPTLWHSILTLVSLLFPIFSKQTWLQSVCHKTLTKQSLCVQKPEQHRKLGNVLNPSTKVFYVPTF